jgi:dTDP-4-dehydrorhamnose reductase
MKRLLILGGSGKLGTELKLLSETVMEVNCPSSTDCDITKYDDLAKVIQSFKPHIVINAAAIVGLKECEDNKDKAWRVNTLGALNVAKCCNENNNRLVHISTCIVFDGKKGNYLETDTPSPTSFYAITKVAAEQAVSVLNNSAIIRLDFYPKEKLKYSKIYTDHFTSKTSVTEATKKILKIADSDFVGIINIGTTRKSLYEILKPVFPEITPITIAQSTMTDFPRDISLDLSKWNTLME